MPVETIVERRYTVTGESETDPSRVEVGWIDNEKTVVFLAQDATDRIALAPHMARALSAALRMLLDGENS